MNYKKIIKKHLRVSFRFFFNRHCLFLLKIHTASLFPRGTEVNMDAVILLHLVFPFVLLSFSDCRWTSVKIQDVVETLRGWCRGVKDSRDAAESRIFLKLLSRFERHRFLLLLSLQSTYYDCIAVLKSTTLWCTGVICVHYLNTLSLWGVGQSGKKKNRFFFWLYLEVV